MVFGEGEESYTKKETTAIVSWVQNKVLNLEGQIRVGQIDNHIIILKVVYQLSTNQRFACTYFPGNFYKPFGHTQCAEQHFQRFVMRLKSTVELRVRGERKRHFR